MTRTLIPAMLALLASALIGGCGKQDAAADAVAWLERSFRSGDIKQNLNTGERIAFSRIDGLRRRGSNVLEGMGVQYRLVRVEAIAPDAAHLQGEGDRRLVTDETYELVADGDIARVAEIHAEVLPDRDWLQEHAMQLIAEGSGANASPFTRTFILVHDSEQWYLARGSAETSARRLLGVYRSTESLQSRVISRELAQRLVTTAPSSN